ncbi:MULTISPECIES: LysR family transcriptional regulator [unclassified Duganella]|uniref:LysR family transcriptional regulator n=1 Tax=unclassified Duganella TaxID=2636909 RepID=UPI00088E7466|nr:MULTISPECIES: LysR family transcriptional regulator [unclassified Duganella]SDG18988.1 DNA-binding transcriptional regulator, LysR family [Duganella sp. OV458]SDJ29112.1 transcriptional regulator, LysR family [Duganella sp. OV510]
MARDNINDILVFLAVARERSFTRAAAKLGMTQSALSHIIRSLESRLGVRLLTRTTRSVSPTEAGERLLQNVAPRLEEVEAEIAAISDLGDKPSGTVRITAIDFVVDSLLWPRIAPLLLEYPDLQVEIHSDYRLIDIAAERFDIGVRHGDQVEKDMIAVRLTDEVPMAIVAAPAYFALRQPPQSIAELLRHNCIVMRLPSSGGIYAWELQDQGRAVDAKVRGQAIFTSVYPMLDAALAGCGIAFIPHSLAAQHIQSGRLVQVMQQFCKPFEPLYAFYPSRRHSSRALGLVVDAIRHPG